MEKPKQAIWMICLLLLASCTTKFSEVDGREDGEDNLETDDDGQGCAAGPCCDTDSGLFMGTETVCDSRTEYRCVGGCGAEAQSRTVDQHCSGSSSECDGNTSEQPWATLPDGSCGPDQACYTNGTSSASCVTCEAGCNPADGTCAIGCTPGPTRPCCSEDGRLLDTSQVCDTTTEWRCSGTGCGDDVEQLVSYQHCSGISSDCNGAIVGDWTIIHDCDPNSLCRHPYGEDPFCDSCPDGCDATSDACFADCSPDEPCCDGEGHFRGSDVRCAPDPVETEYFCDGTACEADAVERQIFRNCTGTSAECGDGNLQNLDIVTGCSGEIVCVSDGTYAACGSCDYICANTSAGVGLCYDDPYERNDSAPEAFGVGFDTNYTGSKLNGDFDPVDFFGFSLDESGGESYLVTASVHVSSVSGTLPYRVTLAFTDPGGSRIVERTINSVTAGGDYDLTYVLSGGAPTPDRFAFSVATDVGDLAMDTFVRLSRTPQPSASIDCGLFGDAYEPNNGIGEAFTISLGTVYPMAALCRLIDTVDVFRFAIPGSEPVMVTARANILVSTEDDGNFGINWLRVDGREYGRSGFSCWTGISNPYSKTLNPGTYFVVFDKIFPDDIFVNYTFTLDTSTPCSDDVYDLPPNDDDFEDGAIAVTSGTMINGVFCDLDADWRAIDLAPGDTLSVSTTVPSYMGPMRTIIFNPGGTQCIRVDGTGPGPQTANCTASTAGVYQIMTMIWADQRSYTQTFNLM